MYEHARSNNAVARTFYNLFCQVLWLVLNQFNRMYSGRIYVMKTCTYLSLTFYCVRKKIYILVALKAFRSFYLKGPYFVYAVLFEKAAHVLSSFKNVF